MKLFLKLKEQTKLSSEHKFVYAVLKQLAAAEVAASICFTSLSPSLESIQIQFAQSLKNAVIFRQIGVLAQLIASACEKDWQGKTDKDVKKIGLDSAKKIFPAFNEPRIKDALDKWVKEQSLKIENHLSLPALITDINIIKTILMSCFPAINETELDTVMESMNQEINRLKSDADWVVDYKNLGFFESKQPNEPAITEKTSSCTIC